MSVAPLAAGRHSIRGSRRTTQNVEEGFRFEGPGQATRDSRRTTSRGTPPTWRRCTGSSPGAPSPWAGMRLASLKASYRKEYAELAAGGRGQGELL